jgi:predicted heme/steroid binding protein
MKNTKLVVISIVLAGGVVAAAIALRGGDSNEGETLSAISEQQLKDADGKDGRACWLAIDGVVYEIEQGFKWSEGEHTESSDAYCGADMSAVIDQAPHGRTKLDQLKKVGTFN